MQEDFNNLSLNGRERQNLVDKLLKCISIDDDDTRNIIIKDLSEELHSTIRRHRNIKETDVRRLVDACLNYPNGLTMLVEMIEQREPNATPVQKVKKFVEEAYASAAREKRRPQYAKLLLILSTVTESNLARVDLENFYRVSVTDNHVSQFNYPRGESKVETLFAILEKLRDMFDTDRVPALLKFVERVATAIRTKKLSTELTRWVDETALAWSISSEDLKILRAKIAKELSDTEKHHSDTPTAQRPYILIKLKAAEEGNGYPEKFSAEAWIYSGPDDIDYEYVPKQGEFYTATTIGRLLDKLVAQVNGSTKIDPRMKGKYAIDFFLPRELFYCPVESWPYEGGFPLGILSQVVIRSSEERLRDGTFKFRLKDKWATLHSLTPSVGKAPVHWVNGVDELDATRVFPALMAEHIVCLGFTLVPPTITDPCNKQELFYSMFIAGTPIALWPRHTPDSQDLERLKRFQSGIRSLARRRQLSNLPELVWQQRQKAYKEMKEMGEDHLGYCLALLWDDPNRVPPKDPLVEPELAKD